MFSWLNSPQLPDTIETQAFRSIAGGPTLRIGAINDRTHKMKLIPWEDILEVFPTAIYLRDANGIVMPARDGSSKRITPRSIKLQADVVLEVVSNEDIPPKSTRPDNITITKDLPPEHSESALSTSPINRRSTDHTAAAAAQRTSTSTTGSVHQTRKSVSSSSTAEIAAATAAKTPQLENDESDWLPFQANSAPPLAIPSDTVPSEQVEILRQEIVHRLELFSAEQEERLSIIIRACQNRPTR
ncbi:hypothetical protein BGZ99_001002 [Dissophora globulifera]|uniref:Uncharacterized protein n=1 Tax=Dissophora globulifera TaxID=979702 RepID=A0A9P6UY06_9FUNG|nr:hypothetical protein BGZ99_001002 [Dissophora globulifera]